MKSYFELKSPAQSKNSNSSSRGKKEKTCSAINFYYNDLRSEIDQKMQSFIISRNGMIDSWPASFSEDIDIFEGGVTVFDYFGKIIRI